MIRKVGYHARKGHGLLLFAGEDRWKAQPSSSMPVIVVGVVCWGFGDLLADPEADGRPNHKGHQIGHKQPDNHFKAIEEPFLRLLIVLKLRAHLGFRAIWRGGECRADLSVSVAQELARRQNFGPRTPIPDPVGVLAWREHVFD